MYYFSCKKRFRLRKKWKDEFGGDLYFFHGSSNSWGVLIVFYGNQDITVKKSDKKERVLVLDERIDDSDFLL